jgi:hypothetical protein
MPNQPRTRNSRGVLRWCGWVMSGLAIAFLLMDASMKLLALPVVLQANAALGFQGEGMARGLGVTLLGCTLLYAIPHTAMLGAIALTGFLGGAVAAKLRVDDPLLTHVLFGVYVGAFVWGGLYLRDARLRQILPLRQSARSE